MTGHGLDDANQDFARRKLIDFLKSRRLYLDKGVSRR